MRLVLASAAVAAALSSSACGAAVGCDLRPDEDRCQERTGIQTFGFGPFCDGIGGAQVEGGCPDEGKVLGCDLGEVGGGSFIDWYYEPTTRAEAEEKCADEDGTIIEP